MQTKTANTRETLNANRDHAGGLPDWAALNHVSIVAVGTSSQPTERMMNAQSGVYRLIVALESIRLPKRLPPLRGLFGEALQKPARG